MNKPKYALITLGIVNKIVGGGITLFKKNDLQGIFSGLNNTEILRAAQLPQNIEFPQNINEENAFIIRLNQEENLTFVTLYRYSGVGHEGRTNYYAASLALKKDKTIPDVKKVLEILKNACEWSKKCKESLEEDQSIESEEFPDFDLVYGKNQNADDPIFLRNIVYIDQSISKLESKTIEFFLRKNIGEEGSFLLSNVKLSLPSFIKFEEQEIIPSESYPTERETAMPELLSFESNVTPDDNEKGEQENQQKCEGAVIPALIEVETDNETSEKKQLPVIYNWSFKPLIIVLSKIGFVIGLVLIIIVSSYLMMDNFNEKSSTVLVIDTLVQEGDKNECFVPKVKSNENCANEIARKLKNIDELKKNKQDSLCLVEINETLTLFPLCDILFNKEVVKNGLVDMVLEINSSNGKSEGGRRGEEKPICRCKVGLLTIEFLNEKNFDQTPKQSDSTTLFRIGEFGIFSHSCNDSDITLVFDSNGFKINHLGFKYVSVIISEESKKMHVELKKLDD